MENYIKPDKTLNENRIGLGCNPIEAEEKREFECCFTEGSCSYDEAYLNYTLEDICNRLNRLGMHFIGDDWTCYIVPDRPVSFKDSTKKNLEMATSIGGMLMALESIIK